MLALARSLVKNRRLLSDFVARDLKARYVGSSMGFFWSVIFPIINLLIYSFVFRIILKIRWADAMPPEEAVLMMFAGILVWVAFGESVSRITNSLVENANLIQKVVFPSEILAPYLTVSSLVNMTLGLPVLMAGVLWFGYAQPREEGVAALAPAALTVEVAGPVADPAALFRQEPDWRAPLRKELEELKGRTAHLEALLLSDRAPVKVTIERRPLGLGLGLLCLPLLMVLQAMFMVGLGYLLSTLNLFLRDTYHLVGVLLTVWMFATPIFYPAFLVQKEGFGWLLVANPMYRLIESYRSVLLYGAFPPLLDLVLFAAVALATLILGAAFFKAQKRRFPDLL